MKGKGSLLFMLLSIFILAPALVGCKDKSSDKHDETTVDKPRYLAVEDGSFMLDSSYIRIVSTEFNYAFTPRDYWNDWLKLIKLSGFNTVFVRVPWVLHEPEEGVFDFSGEKDLKELCRLARENNLLVWLNVGPYVGGKMDMGGMPWWLLKDDNIALRSTQTAFMSRVKRYFARLGKELSHCQLQNGGAIALIQIDEPDITGRNHKLYLSALRDKLIESGFDKTLFTVASTADEMHNVQVDGTIKTVVIDGAESAMGNFVGIRKRDPGAPVLCYEIDPYCYNLLGNDTLLRNMNNVYLRAYEVLRDGGSLNIGSICAGVAYGGVAGAELDNGKYVPYSTLFNNGVTVTLEGYLYDGHQRFVELFRSYGKIEGDRELKLSEVENVAMLDAWRVSMVSPLFDNLPEPVISESPLSMEQCGVGYGAMLYTAMLPPLKGGEKIVVDARDNAQVFLNDALVATLYRSNGDSIATLPASKDSVRLSILVDVMGRVAPIDGYKDRKGLVGDVYLLSSGKRVKVSSWSNYPLPSSYGVVSSKNYSRLIGSTAPGYYKTSFTKSEKGHIHLSFASWGHGEAWVNGRSLGRFFSHGEECTLFIPDCWIKDGENELIILDYVGPSEAILSTRKYI